MYDKEKYNKFDSFLNLTIILSSKRYYKYEKIRDYNELKILDDTNFSKNIDYYLKYEDTLFNNVNLNDFINHLDNDNLVYALKSLSNIEKIVIFLLFNEQLTSAETSKILKICSDSVTRIKRRALNKIEKYLKGDF